MKQFYLTEITTKDKLLHQGLYFKPKKPTKKAMLWVHGLTSTFYGGVRMLEAFVDACEKQGIGFAAFNNRGHDIVTGIKKIDPREAKGYTRMNGGAGYERFEDCIYDIDAGVSFLENQGFSEIILAGHSTGANKVCYYAGTKRDYRITGVIFLSPVSDRLDPSLDKERMEKQLRAMKRKISDGKGDVLVSGVHVFPATPMRYVSSFFAHSPEDVFDYGEATPRFARFSAIGRPLLVVFGSKDEYLDRPAEKVFDVFARYTRSRKYQGVIIPGALHSFNGKEKEVVDVTLRWVSQI